MFRIKATFYRSFSQLQANRAIQPRSPGKKVDVQPIQKNLACVSRNPRNFSRQFRAPEFPTDLKNEDVSRHEILQQICPFVSWTGLQLYGFSGPKSFRDVRETGPWFSLRGTVICSLLFSGLFGMFLYCFQTNTKVLVIVNCAKTFSITQEYIRFSFINFLSRSSKSVNYYPGCFFSKPGSICWSKKRWQFCLWKYC